MSFVDWENEWENFREYSVAYGTVARRGHALVVPLVPLVIAVLLAWVRVLWCF
jgi:hypothetical protein